jgi:hypothetical protein
MKIYWAGDRGFIEINGEELEGRAKVEMDAGRLDVHIHVDMRLDDTRKIYADGVLLNKKDLFATDPDKWTGAADDN